MYPMWCWSIDPTQRFICSSYAADVALDHADKCRLIFRSDRYQRYFPTINPDRNNEAKSQFKNVLGGERYATSTGASITGTHGHQIIIDDPINPEQASSEADRKTANKYLDETLFTRKVDKQVTPTIMIMQRLHEDDCTGHILSKKLRVRHICLPAELSDNVKPAELKKFYVNGLFDPARLSHQIITAMREALGTYAASGQLDQLPSPAEGGILKKRWFEIVDKTIPKNVAIKVRLDTAYTEDQVNDPSGFFAYFMENGIMHVVNAEEQYLEFPELEKYIPVYCFNHGCDSRSTIKVEPKATGKSVVQKLKNIQGLNIFEGRVPKDDKTARVNAIAPSCEAGKVKLIRGAWNQKFLDQLGGFPNAKHDDMLDCFTEAGKEEFIEGGSDYGFRKVN